MSQENHPNNIIDFVAFKKEKERTRKTQTQLPIEKPLSSLSELAVRMWYQILPQDPTDSAIVHAEEHILIDPIEFGKTEVSHVVFPDGI